MLLHIDMHTCLIDRYLYANDAILIFFLLLLQCNENFPILHLQIDRALLKYVKKSETV